MGPGGNEQSAASFGPGAREGLPTAEQLRLCNQDFGWDLSGVLAAGARLGGCGTTRVSWG
jgi:hypothetical protein